MDETLFINGYMGILILIIIFLVIYMLFDEKTISKILNIFSNSFPSKVETPSSNNNDSMYKSFLEWLNAELKSRADIDTSNTDVFQKYGKILGVMLSCTFVVSFITMYALTDKNALTTKLYYYIIIIMVPCVLGLYIGKDFIGKTPVPVEDLYKYIPYAIGIIFLGILLNSIPDDANTIMIFNYIFYLLFFLIVIGGLAIIYFVFSNFLKKQTGVLGFIIHFLFYIPCLFGNFVEFIKEELALTPPIIFLLFIMEILFILLYIYIPKLLQYINKKNSDLLLNNPVVLNKEIVIADSSKFVLKAPSKTYLEKLKDTFSYNKPSSHSNSLQTKVLNYKNNNYAISFWVYVNPGSSNSIGYQKESTIFDYADGKPKITYINNKDTKNKFVVYFSNNFNTDTAKYEIESKNQEWIYFAINYYNTSADLFINGHLERTFVLNENLPFSGNSTDSIKVGDNTGVNGAICNVNYYLTPLSIYSITSTFNLLRYKNPPVFIE
jgi:hypothetical protein